MSGELNKTETNHSLNVLFIQDSSPCIRNIKYAGILFQSNIKVHLLYKNKEPDKNYGFGNGFYASLNKFKYRFQIRKLVKKIIIDKDIDLIHYHNQPDIVCDNLIKMKLKVPIIYDCHDFMSFKKRLSYREKDAERRCNEDSEGVIYQTESYLNAALQYYKLTPKRHIFGNYFPAANLLKPEDFNVKLSAQDNKIHLVFQGRLAEKKNDHRYIIKYLEKFDKDRFIIHIHPSNNKKFVEYKALPNVLVHEKLSYRDLVRTMSQYDFGMVLFNEEIGEKVDIFLYALGNKAYDYLCAGIPILAQDSLPEVVKLIKDNSFGYLLSEFPEDNSLIFSDYPRFVNNIIIKREDFASETQATALIEFYHDIIRNYKRG
jgi:hypothetical protein